ncbi:MAG: DUF4037 domain-containing protein [Caldilineales bacterium]
MAAPPFLPGLTLNRLFFAEVVQPLLARAYPGLAYSAALIGYGSDVLGFDTRQSADHNWGPRLQLFLAQGDYAPLAGDLDQTLSDQLPVSFLGYPVNFSEPDLSDGGTQVMQAVAAGPVRHMIEIRTVDQYFRRYLGIAPDAALTPLDWLALPQQQLLEITAGEVFHDGLATLETARARFAWFPRDVWLYRMRAQWARIAQEEPFVGRAGQAGDDPGSRIVAARLVRDLMLLAFLHERRYAPYSKWLGTAFSRLSCAATLTPLFEAALSAPDWQTRQQPLADAYEVLAATHNALNLTPPVDPTTRPFFNRPFQVLFAGRFADALRDVIGDATLRSLPAIGAVDQFVDSTDLTDQPALVARLHGVYR